MIHFFQNGIRSLKSSPLPSFSFWNNFVTCVQVLNDIFWQLLVLNWRHTGASKNILIAFYHFVLVLTLSLSLDCRKQKVSFFRFERKRIDQSRFLWPSYFCFGSLILLFVFSHSSGWFETAEGGRLKLSISGRYRLFKPISSQISLL